MKRENKEEYERGYKDGYNRGGIIALIIIGIIIMGIWTIIYYNDFYKDNGDIINTKELGKKMCEEKKLEYDHKELIYVIDNNKNIRVPIPKIYCKNPEENEEKIEDEYLVLIKG